MLQNRGGIKVHVYRVSRISRRVNGPRRTRNIFSSLSMTRAISEQSEFYFEQTFHTLPSRPVFLIRSRAQAPFSFSITKKNFLIDDYNKQNHLNPRFLLVQEEERKKREGKEETKGTNDLQTQKDHEPLAHPAHPRNSPSRVAQPYILILNTDAGTLEDGGSKDERRRGEARRRLLGGKTKGWLVQARNAAIGKVAGAAATIDLLLRSMGLKCFQPSWSLRHGHSCTA